MEIEVSAEAKDKRLNRRVAITVVALSIFMGFCNIKDGNIVQAMQQAQSDAVDSWNEYQATRTKLHLAEVARAETGIIGGSRPEATALIAEYDRSVAKYQAEAPQLAAKAKAFSSKYDALNVHDDQFDAGEASMATAISIAAVASLVEAPWVLAAAWLFGAFGMFMGLAGFLGWSVHPDLLSTLLG